MADQIKEAYQSSKNIYDNVLTQRNFLSRLYAKVFWSGTDDNEIAHKVLSYIPDDFDGTILDVPVGTAVFTEQKWASLKNAHITCLDYSTDMLEQAEKRLNGCGHIRCVQGDAGNLQMDDAAFDVIVSMNGFHACFEARREIHRLLLYKRQIRDYRLACRKYFFKEGLVYASFSNRRTTAEYFEPPI